MEEPAYLSTVVALTDFYEHWDTKYEQWSTLYTHIVRVAASVVQHVCPDWRTVLENDDLDEIKGVALLKHPRRLELPTSIQSASSLLDKVCTIKKIQGATYAVNVEDLRTSLAGAKLSMAVLTVNITIHKSTPATESAKETAGLIREATARLKHKS